MNFFGNVQQLELAVSACPLYKHTFASPILLMTIVFPHYMTFSLLAISLYRQELYVFLISISLTLSYPLNFLLQNIFRDAPRFIGCYSEFGGPSFASQQLMFLIVILASYPFFFQRPFKIKAVFVLNFVNVFILFSWVWIGANTNLELFAGSIVGTILALLFQLFVYFIVSHRVQWLLGTSILQMLGFMDTLIIYVDPLTFVVTPQVPSFIN